jgi:hypothetical protein
VCRVDGINLMGLLSEIQKGLFTEDASIGMALLKLRYLASRLDSQVLEEWVRHETEGYPKDSTVPEYRVTDITYSGTFVGFSNIMHKVPVSSYVVAKYVGNDWIHYPIRDSISVIDDIVKRDKKGGQYAVNTGDILTVLRDKIFDSHQCTHLQGVFDVSVFLKIQSSVRARVLDLTIDLEKRVPSSTEIMVGGKAVSLPKVEADEVAKIIQNFFGPVGSVATANSSGVMNVNVVQGDLSSLLGALVAGGIPEKEAKEFADIIKEDTPESPMEPLGQRTRAWIADKAGKLGWIISTEAIKEAVKAFYGL